MSYIPRPSLQVWIERLLIIALTSLFHYFPVPTLTLVALICAVRLGSVKAPPEYRD